jgi:hypothetical protein
MPDLATELHGRDTGDYVLSILSPFPDFVSKHPVTRPIQDSREFVVAHSAESSRTAPLRKPALLLSLYEFLLRAGKTKGQYKEEFPRGSTVQIADRAFLENFLKTLKFHHKLERQQLNYANKIAKLKSVGFYHGGTELYELKGVPRLWHEQCLRASVSHR